MSLDALTWAFKQPVSPATKKFVLVALADFANEEFEAYPSVSTLERKTSLNRKTIMSSLDALVLDDILLDTGRRCGATGQIKVFQLKIPENGILTAKSPKNGTIPFLPSKSPVFTTKASLKRDREPSEGTVREERSDHPAVAGGHSEFVTRWFNEFQGFFGEPYDGSSMGKDGRNLSLFLKNSERSVDELISLAKQAWERHSEFGFGQSTTISGFCGSVNQIIAKLATTGKGVVEGSNRREHLSSPIL